MARALMKLANSLILSLILLLLSHGFGVQAVSPQNRFGIEAIYQFGDSLSDTGNLIRDNPIGARSNFARLPYGINFMHHPTGRCSDGLLMIDYFANFFNLPLLDPYLKRDGNFLHGVNFAVAGSTALDASTLASKHIRLPATNSSLSVQLNWFKSHLPSICSSSSDCKEKLGRAIFFMGEVGGNDFNFAIFQGKTMQDLRNMVPQVVREIKYAVNEVIKLGAIRVVIPGNFPIGCMPIYLASFGTNDPTMYDELRCLKGLNEFAEFQNDHVQQAIRQLQQEHPHVTFIYGDYYNGLRAVLRYGSALGFDREATQRACCGSGDNPYHFNVARMCGDIGTQVCLNPSSHVSWDGVHLTSNAYQHLARFLLRDIVRGISRVA